MRFSSGDTLSEDRRTRSSAPQH